VMSQAAAVFASCSMESMMFWFDAHEIQSGSVLREQMATSLPW